MPLMILTFSLSLLLSSCVYESQHTTPSEYNLYGYNSTTLEIQQ
jgi:hypothetical protein